MYLLELQLSLAPSLPHPAHGPRSPTSVIEDPSLRPVLDDHGQRPYSFIDLNVGLNHPRVLECKGIIHVHVTRKP